MTAVKKLSRISWRAPTAMLGAWVVGILLVVGHDQHYHRLAGRPVKVDDYRIGAFSYSHQQFNLTVGFVLAFLVKVSLVTAASTAHTQLFWTAVKAQSRKGGISVSKVDAMHQAASNLVAFVRPVSWLSTPGPALVALTIWLIPIASIFTPATLSVGIRDQLPLNVTKLDVPGLDFRSLAFAQKMPPQNLGSSNFDYTGPSPEVLDIARTTATNGAILPVVPPAPNSTWSAAFHGPSLQCSEVSGKKLEAVLMDIARWIRANSQCNHAAGYLSWMQRHPGFEIDLPYDNHAVSQKHNSSDPGYFESGSLSYSSTEGGSDVSLLVALMPNMVEEQYYWETPRRVSCSIPFNRDPLGVLAEEATLIQCRLVNVTYTTKFDFVDGRQNLNVETSRSDTSPETIKVIKTVYRSLDERSCLGDNDDGQFTRDGSQCEPNDLVLERLSYQSIMSAFSSLIKGQVSRDSGYGSASGLTLNTNVGTTSLARLEELKFLTDERYTVETSLQEFLINSNQPALHGVGKLYETAANTTNNTASLTEALEELFQNITISLMSSSSLQANKSSVTAPPPASVTFPLSVPTYIYARQKLWLAYGIAILLCSVATIAGLVVAYLRQKTYDASFSTILRATRHAELSTEVSMEDTDGKLPLPAYLASSTIRFDTCNQLMQIPSGLPADFEAQTGHMSPSYQRADDAAGGAEPPPYTAAIGTPHRSPSAVSSVAEDTTSVAESARVSLLQSNPDDVEHCGTRSAELEIDETSAAENNASER